MDLFMSPAPVEHDLSPAPVEQNPSPSSPEAPLGTTTLPLPMLNVDEDEDPVLSPASPKPKKKMRYPLSKKRGVLTAKKKKRGTKPFKTPDTIQSDEDEFSFSPVPKTSEHAEVDEGKEKPTEMDEDEEESMEEPSPAREPTAAEQRDKGLALVAYDEVRALKTVGVLNSKTTRDRLEMIMGFPAALQRRYNKTSQMDTSMMPKSRIVDKQGNRLDPAGLLEPKNALAAGVLEQIFNPRDQGFVLCETDDGSLVLIPMAMCRMATFTTDKFQAPTIEGTSKFFVLRKRTGKKNTDPKTFFAVIPRLEVTEAGAYVLILSGMWFAAKGVHTQTALPQYAVHGTTPHTVSCEVRIPEGTDPRVSTFKYLMDKKVGAMSHLIECLYEQMTLSSADDKKKTDTLMPNPSFFLLHCIRNQQADTSSAASAEQTQMAIDADIREAHDRVDTGISRFFTVFSTMDLFPKLTNKQGRILPLPDFIRTVEQYVVPSADPTKLTKAKESIGIVMNVSPRDYMANTLPMTCFLRGIPEILNNQREFAREHGASKDEAALRKELHVAQNKEANAKQALGMAQRDMEEFKAKIKQMEQNLLDLEGVGMGDSDITQSLRKDLEAAQARIARDVEAQATAEAEIKEARETIVQMKDQQQKEKDEAQKQIDIMKKMCNERNEWVDRLTTERDEALAAAAEAVKTATATSSSGVVVDPVEFEARMTEIFDQMEGKKSQKHNLRKRAAPEDEFVPIDQERAKMARAGMSKLISSFLKNEE